MSTFEWISTLVAVIGLLVSMWIQLDKKLSAIYDRLNDKVCRTECQKEMHAMHVRLKEIEDRIFKRQPKNRKD